MKLAEALILRADAQKRIEQLKARLLGSAKHQEGELPAEDPVALLAELERTTAQLRDLVQRINRTNAATAFDETRTLTDVLAERDVLGQFRGILTDLATAATIKQDRYSKSEVKFKSSVSIADTLARADAMSRDYRELDARVQALNWSTELA